MKLHFKKWPDYGGVEDRKRLTSEANSPDGPSKNKLRRHRRQNGMTLPGDGQHARRRVAYRGYLGVLHDALSDDPQERGEPREQAFKKRVIDAMDHDGFDIAPDGRRVKADFWKAAETFRKNGGAVDGLAAENFIGQAVDKVSRRRV